MYPTTEAERRAFDDQDVWLEMRNGGYGNFGRHLAEAALAGDPLNRRKLKEAFAEYFAAAERELSLR